MNNKKSAKVKIGVMDVILVFIAITLVGFTIAMLCTFFKFGSIPDTLCNCVFGVLGTECGAMAWIKTTKERNKERKYEKEDRKYFTKKESASYNSRNNE